MQASKQTKLPQINSNSTSSNSSDSVQVFCACYLWLPLPTSFLSEDYSRAPSTPFEHVFLSLDLNAISSYLSKVTVKFHFLSKKPEKRGCCIGDVRPLSALSAAPSCTLRCSRSMHWEHSAIRSMHLRKSSKQLCLQFPKLHLNIFGLVSSMSAVS